MRSTSAAPASSMRARAAADAPSDPLLASMDAPSKLFSLFLIPMDSQPGSRESLASFFLEYLVHAAMILGTVAGNAIQNKAAEREREGPLADFPQFVIGLTLGAHDGNLVNGGVFEADLAIDGPNGGLARLRVGQIKAHGTRLHQHRS